MSELDHHGLPPLPPARPMTDADWERLHAKVFGTIAAHERRRRTRLLLIAAAVLVVALIVVAAAWELTRPSANSRTDVTVLCASEPVALGGGAIVTPDGLDPVTRCRREWEAGSVKPGQTVAPALVACARGEYEESVQVTVFPALPGNTCAALAYDPVPAGFAEQALQFEQVQDALAALPDAQGDCVPYDRAREVAEQALRDAGLEGWEVARDGSFDGDDSCFSTWLFDYDQRLLYLFGTG
jgi:hypothetical protein